MDTIKVPLSETADPTAKNAIAKILFSKRMKLVERCAEAADKDLAKYILKGVTEGVSYTYLKMKMDIPCSREVYYNRYRQFFWLLSAARKNVYTSQILQPLL